MRLKKLLCWMCGLCLITSMTSCGDVDDPITLLKMHPSVFYTVACSPDLLEFFDLKMKITDFENNSDSHEMSEWRNRDGYYGPVLYKEKADELGFNNNLLYKYCGFWIKTYKAYEGTCGAEFYFEPKFAYTYSSDEGYIIKNLNVDEGRRYEFGSYIITRPYYDYDGMEDTYLQTYFVEATSDECSLEDCLKKILERGKPAMRFELEFNGETITFK